MGYLFRLAELNRFDTPSWMLQLAQISSYVRSSLSFNFGVALNLSSLAKLAGVGKADLATLIYTPVDQSRSIGDYLVFGRAVPQYMIRVRQPKVCSVCLLEASYARKIWDLSPMTACPIHRCLLLDECPNCAKRISWARLKINHCGCSFDWRNCEIQTVNDSGLKVSQQIYLRCNLQQAKDIISEEVKDNPLYNVNLKNFLSALFFIASQYAGRIDTKGKHLGPSMRNTDLHVLLCKAWAVFENWPSNYFNFLVWRRSQIADSPSVRGLRRDFAEYKSALYKQLAVPELEFMRTAFEEYLVEHWDGGYISHVKRLNDVVVHKGKYASRREVKDLLRVGVQSIDKLITIGRLKAIVKRQGGTRLILIERASLVEFKHVLDQSLYLKQVQGKLGLSHKRVLELVVCGLLNPVRGPSIDGCSDWKFGEEEVSGLLDQIEKRVMSQASVAIGSTMSLLIALRRLNSIDVKMGQFIVDILNEKIAPCGRGEKPGLASFLFSKNQVMDYAVRKRESRLN